MTTIVCTFAEFKQMAKEFHDAIPTADLPSLDAGWKCLGLAYFGMNEEMWRHSSVILLQIMSREYNNRVVELIMLDERI